MSEFAAKVSTRIASDRDAVWDALTNPEAIKKYFMGATVATDWKRGSPITWSGDWKGKPFQDKGEILEVTPKQRLSYSHWSPLGGMPMPKGVARRSNSRSRTWSAASRKPTASTKPTTRRTGQRSSTASKARSKANRRSP